MQIVIEKPVVSAEMRYADLCVGDKFCVVDGTPGRCWLHTDYRYRSNLILSFPLSNFPPATSAPR